ncbi:MAG: VCBS repeat-containing protein, partial [Kiritimatiellota bacterium]|nr:VCBS repeat-containing protein [Kiritimatiellota bacterium]
EQAAIIEANNGRTICNWFLFDDMALTNGPKLLQNEITYAVKPTLPTVDASMGEFSDRIRVSWNSTAATQYTLLRSTNATSGFVSLGVLAGTASNYDDTAVTLPGTYYYYSVNASNAFGTRGNSVAHPGWRRSAENHAVGDYDGDGRADPAVYNQTTGEWAIRFSINDSYALFKIILSGMGDPGFIAVTADYDNDGIPDPGAYNASTGEWRIRLSGSGYYLLISTLNNLGGALFYSSLGADFDGDGLADPIVYQESNGGWRFMLSSYDYLQYEAHFGNLGGMGWSMAWADYDGDGYADPIVYQETTGTWKILLSDSGYALMTTTFNSLGGLGFIPVIADYDGDGHADPAVCNLATGEWRIMFSGVRVTAYLTF